MIGVDAAMNVSAAGISAGNAFDAEIDNHGLGNIVGSANINFNLTGDLTTGGNATLLISNDSVGTIGSDAVISVTANDISTGALLTPLSTTAAVARSPGLPTFPSISAAISLRRATRFSKSITPMGE